MNSFLQWCEEKQNDVQAVLKDIETLDGKEVNSESRIRTGLRPAYPDAYYRSQYPDLYSTPSSATAALDLQNAKKTKSKSSV